MCVGLTPAQTHGTCTPANGKRGAVRTRTGVWGNSRGLRGDVVRLDRLVEAELLLLRIETRDERKGHTARASVAKPGIGGGRATTVRWQCQSACAMAYIITSWFIAVRMLRLLRTNKRDGTSVWAWIGKAG